MKIAILTIGTRGDVQPYLALALSLRRAGHGVKLVAPAVFEPLVSGYDVDFIPLPGDPMRLITELVERGGRNAFRSLKVMYDHALPIAADTIRIVRAACDEVDCIASAFVLHIAGSLTARERGIPHIAAHLFPTFSSTSSFPSAALPQLPLGAIYNRLTHWIFMCAYWQANRIGYCTLRRRLPDTSFPALDNPFSPEARAHGLTLYGFSPAVLPPPPDWGNNVRVTGYWFLDAPETWSPPQSLIAFLDAGEPPIAVGFGSMIPRDVQRLSSTVLDGIIRSGQRAVLIGGWGAIEAQTVPDALRERVRFIESVPHDWLFPRVRAVVHHGGAGTTAAALRAGVPQVVVPFTADQPFWAQRMFRLGVAPRPLARHADAAAFAHALREVTHQDSMRIRAAQLGSIIRAETGAASAVRAIEAYVLSG
jgi:UDP:flavonoid glycosyltransferase YjiC (YdhE family)